MFILKIPTQKIYDEATSTFHHIDGITLHLEHSLVAISKWEMKWQKPFLDPNAERTIEEVRDYIKCMCIDDQETLNQDVWKCISRKDIKDIEDYISNKMTASTVNNRNKKSQRKSQILTSELLYYYLSALNIPFECETWHLSRLIMLLQIAAAEQQTPQKMPKNEMIAQRNALNKARQAKMRRN